MKFDVVIVGAGPAGLNCAEKLKGKSVLVLEADNHIGRKVCAGGLTPESLDYLKLPANVLERSFRKITVHTTTQDPVNFGYRICTINRESLGKWMLRKAERSGAEIRTGSRVTQIGRGYVIVNKEKIRFKSLVGADGPSSFVRRHLGLPASDMGIAFHYLIPGRYKRPELFFNPRLFGTWYAWIFPHKDCASIGCGCDPRVISPQRIKRGFHQWLRDMDIDFSSGQYEASPINYDYRGHAFGSTFLTGEAAGLSSGITGEGIYQALVSGEEIANIILGKGGLKGMQEILKTKKGESSLLRKVNLLMKSGKHAAIENTILRYFSD
jgi:flavin-dependent dehydrogenase